jgi:ribosome-binding protein aMBF1 (putative translation factor)
VVVSIAHGFDVGVTRARCTETSYYDTYNPWTHGPQRAYFAGMRSQADILERFGKRVRDLRKEAGYSQEGFAAECELDRTYFGGIERGERNVALRNIHRIAKTLRISLSDLMAGL